MEIPKELKNEIWDYCRTNDVLNINDFILKCVKQGFTIEKFGATPNSQIIEKIVEKIIEVPVEKEVFITDDKTVLKLNNKVNLLENKILDLTKELEAEKQRNKRDIYGEG
jgi:hypothetical protein